MSEMRDEVSGVDPAAVGEGPSGGGGHGGPGAPVGPSPAAGGGDDRRRPGAAGAEHMSRFTRAWAWIGGIDPRGMSFAERAKATIVPSLLLLPAGMALVAGFVFALEFRVPATAAAIFAVAWSLFVFALDRSFVVMPTRPRWRGVALVVRLVVAGLIGWVVAEPLVAALFSEDIDAQVEIVREQKRQDALTAIATSPRYGDQAIGVARARLDRARQARTFTGSDPGDVAADPDVTRLRAELAASEQARAVQAASVQTERDGSGGSGRAGEGPRFEEKLRELNRLEAEVASKREALAGAEAAAAARSADSRVAESAAAQSELPVIEADVAAREAERRAVEGVAEDTSQGNSLGIRTEGFAELRSANSWVNQRYWAITLLLIALDVAAVGAKTLMRPSRREELDEIDRTGEVERRRLVNEHRRQELETMFAEDSARNATVRSAMQVDFDERLRSMLEDGRGSEQSPDPRAQRWVEQADDEADHARDSRSWWRQ
jgi:hypothetical protein